VALFEKHGIQQVGFWTVNIGESNADLYYILKWDSLDERQKKFAAFSSGSGLDRGTRQERGGRPMIASFSNSILTPTRFSALK